MEDYDIFHLFYHIFDTKHLICQVSLKSNKAKLSKYTFKMVFSAVRTTLNCYIIMPDPLLFVDIRIVYLYTAIFLAISIRLPERVTLFFSFIIRWCTYISMG